MCFWGLEFGAWCFPQKRLKNSRTGNPGQFHPESAALLRLRFNAHSSSHALGCLAHIGQADAGSGILFGTVQALEDAENPLVMFARDADAVVLNRQTHPAIPLFLCPNTHTRFYARCDKLKTIG